jgi:hypothetical protein
MYDTPKIGGVAREKYIIYKFYMWCNAGAQVLCANYIRLSLRQNDIRRILCVSYVRQRGAPQTYLMRGTHKTKSTYLMCVLCASYVRLMCKSTDRITKYNQAKDYLESGSIRGQLHTTEK